MTPNQRFAELAGICWHEKDMDVNNKTFGYCKHCGEIYWNCKNPDYAAEPWRVLEVMMKREDWPDFCEQIGCYEGKRGIERVDVDYVIDRTGKLRDAAIEWMEGRKG